MKNQKKLKFDLLENAKDSLSHAVEHLTQTATPSTGDYKRVLLDVSHAVELLLKERIRKIHPAFIWRDIDKYKNAEAQTIGSEEAVNRLLKLDGIILSDKTKDTICSCKMIRNKIEHYEFELEPKEANAVIGRMLSFIFTFSEIHLKVNLEADFRKDERWSELIKVYEFFEEHSKTIENGLRDSGIITFNCPSCGADAFVVSSTTCAMCGHREEVETCDSCGDTCLESEGQVVEDVDEDAGPYRFFLCACCMQDQYDEAMGLEMQADSYRND